MIRKVVFPVAGLGTRFLPATRAVPKELLPLLDKPLIQYAAEEAVAAGADTLIFITSPSKPAIRDHFNPDRKLKRAWKKAGHDTRLCLADGIDVEQLRLVFIDQPEALGLGHAVLCARTEFDDADESFGIILPDDVILDPSAGCLADMDSQCLQHGVDNVVAVEPVPWEHTDRYGIVETSRLGSGAERIRSLVEKPKTGTVGSNLAVVGRYLLSTRIFTLLEATEPGVGGELQITDALNQLASEQTMLAHRFSGRRYDCGSKAGFLQATVDFALNDAVQGADFSRFINARARNLP